MTLSIRDIVVLLQEAVY